MTGEIRSPAPGEYFDTSVGGFEDLFAGARFVWEALARLEAYLDRLLAGTHPPGVFGRVMDGASLLRPETIHIGAGAVVEPGAMIVGPAIIGRGSEVRQGAYVRGQVLTGERCVIGHATEAKTAIFLNGSHAPHFNYVGDSILGAGVNLGAGTRLSNLPLFSERDPVTGRRPTLKIPLGDESIDTGLSKLGCILGDGAQTGCNVVTNPGCLIGPRTLVYSQVSLRRGIYPADRIIKLRQALEETPRRDASR